MKTTRHATDEHAIESRLAARLAGGLTARAQVLPQDVTERLRFAREQAVARAREVRQAVPASVTAVAVSGHGAAVLGSFVPWWQRAASLLPLLLLVGGLLLIDHWTVREQVLAAAEIDSQLLSDDLPPAAYSDPGFAEYLRSPAAR
ncbi:MAG: DUF3619 family protein [Rubrivivax sp.]|nr:DUF3619 family protein [Rubrivivax sp.]